VFLQRPSQTPMWGRQSKRAVPFHWSMSSLKRVCSAQVRLDVADSKTEPSLPLTILKAVDLICHLWQQYVNTALLPLASSSVTIRREMVVFNNQSVSRLEGGANQLLQRITDCTLCLPLKPMNPNKFLLSRCTMAFCATHETKA
jgi:hypothetical protein